MSVLPDKKAEKIQWCEGRITPWTTNAVAIGTTAPEASAFESKTQAARAAFVAAEAARDASKNATIVLNTAIDAMELAAAGVIKQVRAKAETTNNPDVYALASIPVPAIPGPIGAPGLPEALKVSLQPNGTLELSWRCNNPAGCHSVIYQVYRKVDSTGDYHYLGGSGEKRFVDTTVPQGVPSVMYQIQGTRSTSIGVAAEFNVNFGVGGGSGATVTAFTGDTKARPARIAA